MRQQLEAEEGRRNGRRMRKELALDRVVIETTGLAEAAPSRHAQDDRIATAAITLDAPIAGSGETRLMPVLDPRDAPDEGI